jgi:AraC-like DNA-binding protein
VAFIEQRPDADLAGHLDCVWTSTHAAGTGGSSSVLPDGCVEIVVALDGHFGLRDRPATRRPPRVTVVGHSTRPLETVFDHCQRLVGARLTPSGALRLLADALPHIVNCSADGADIDPRLAHDMFQAVDQSPALQVPAQVQRLLRSRLERTRIVDRRIEEASLIMRAKAGRASITAVAAQVGLSTRQIDRSFQRRFGLSPKLLARINRFRRAFDTGMLARRGDWAEIAALCGYADQAHLSRDFLEFAGETPERMRRLLTVSHDV